MWDWLQCVHVSKALLEMSGQEGEIVKFKLCQTNKIVVINKKHNYTRNTKNLRGSTIFSSLHELGFNQSTIIK